MLSRIVVIRLIFIGYNEGMQMYYMHLNLCNKSANKDEDIDGKS